MEKNYLTLCDLEAYRMAFNLSNCIWNIVIEWEWFPKKTVGSQFVRASDSISANIAEGFGRYNKKDKIRFYRYAQGSLKEIDDWRNKSVERKLISKEQNGHIAECIDFLGPALNRLIKFTNDKLRYLAI